MSGLIDLHAHSSVSDGTETPAQLVRAAIAAGLDTVAITDHDSTAGWQAACVAAEGSGLTVIPGMEFSTLDGRRSVHLLAYLFNPLDGGIIAETGRIRDARLRRAESIVQRLSVDYDLEWEDVLAQTTEGATVGRPHIADALVAKGHVPNRSAAFESILHPRSGYFEPHYAPGPLDAVRLVVAAGGVPVLAHPATRGRENVIPEDKIAILVEAGLFGLEVHHRENTESGKQRLVELAEKFDLAITGSSDYHGEGKPNRLGENTTTREVLDRIVAAGTGTTAYRG
ncbi:PHP domain-containing protein [Lacisediminihabitans profunda]|uniref:PHP domain-containing protein n=1 Tax=Lacisediminihabitans profunda TaxID=2594790 RepID=A0A5C8USJ2_9MICO|nr:PHP domain-containing protein [Lacisediminihabitans profunda]TXN31217.1 PHP domain-containing protein [Lacisediminihabitans profunda]